MPVNCEQLKEDDIFKIIEAVLFEFPISEIQFFVPKWVEMLPRDHKIKTDLIEQIKGIMGQFSEIKDTVKELKTADSPYIAVSYTHLDSINLMFGITIS